MRHFQTLLILSTLCFTLSAWAAPPVVSEMTPDQALERLMGGNQRFISGKPLYPAQDSSRRSEIVQGQKPFASVLSCSDSRVPPEVIFDKGLGDLFVVRVAGNSVNNEVLGSLEYGSSVLGAPLIMVLGHSKCGAVDAALEGKPLPGKIPSVITPIEPAIQEKHCKTDQEPLTCSIHANVSYVVHQLKNFDPILAPLIKAGKLKVVGATYDLATGVVTLEP